jgi:hypothetical protein
LVKDVLLDGVFEVNIIIEDLYKKLGLLTPRLARYTFRMVDHILTKLVGLIWDLKIHIHGILYVVTFIVMCNSILDSSYSMLLRHPYLCNAKVTHDWGNNVITIDKVGMVQIIVQSRNTWMETPSNLRYFSIMIS